MSADDTATLRAECETFTRYLIDAEPNPHVMAKYLEAHALGVVPPPGGTTPMDHVLVAWARQGGLRARAADVHARFFLRTGLLRRKLVLLLGILETDTEGRRAVDVADGASVLSTFLQLAWWGVRSATFLLIGLPILLVARAQALEAGDVRGEET